MSQSCTGLRSCVSAVRVRRKDRGIIHVKTAFGLDWSIGFIMRACFCTEWNFQMIEDAGAGACRAPTAFLRLSRDNCEIFMTVRKARLMADDIGTLKCSFVQNKSAPLLFQTLNFGRPNGGPPLIMDLHFAPGLPLVRTSNYEGSSRVHDRKQAGHEGFRDAMQLEWRSYLRATFDLGLEHIRFSLRPKAEVLV